MKRDAVAAAAIAAGVLYVDSARAQLQAGPRVVYDGTEPVRPAPATVCLEKSLTRQSDKEGSDINVILKRYEANGELPSTVRQGYFADVSEAPPDLQAAMSVVLEAQEAFMTLPARVRARFENNPELLLEFLADPANRQEAEELRLLEAKPAAEAAPGPEGLPPAA